MKSLASNSLITQVDVELLQRFVVGPNVGRYAFGSGEVATSYPRYGTAKVPWRQALPFLKWHLFRGHSFIFLGCNVCVFRCSDITTFYCETLNSCWDHQRNFFLSIVLGDGWHTEFYLGKTPGIAGVLFIRVQLKLLLNMGNNLIFILGLHHCIPTTFFTGCHAAMT